MFPIDHILVCMGNLKFPAKCSNVPFYCSSVSVFGVQVRRNPDVTDWPAYQCFYKWGEMGTNAPFF